MLLIFALSALLRLIIALPVIRAEVAPAWDEAGYLMAAHGYHALFSSQLGGEPTRQEDADAAYGRGTWPPLHSMVLALSFLLFGPTVGVARVTSILIAALTTPLVWRVSTRLAGPRAGLATALLHLVYPGFVGFAHLLWSENLFLLLVWLGLELCLSSQATTTSAGRLGRAALAGLFLALATLTRISGAAFLVVALLWLARRGGSSTRWLSAAAAALVALITLLPWQWHLNQREPTFALLSAANGYNLLLGQVEPDSGETGPERKQRINQLIRAELNSGQASRDQAARHLALERIGENPLGFVRRCLARIPALFYGEAHLVRHLYQVVYPPLPPAWAMVLRILLLVSYALLLALLIFGLASAGNELRHRRFLIALSIGALLPSLPTVANSRIGMPILLILLPAAGLAVIRLRDHRSAASRFVWVLAALLALQTYRQWHFERGSNWYSELQLAWGLPIRDESQSDDEGEEGPHKPPVGDTILLRATPSDHCQKLEIQSLTPGLEIQTGAMKPPTAQLIWSSVSEPVLAIALRGRNPGNPTRLQLRCASGPAHLSPAGVVLEVAADRTAWHQWRPTGLPGLESYWWGGSEARPIPANLLSP